MNAFVRKEIRNLLPSFALALVAALSWWILPSIDRDNSLLMFPALPIISYAALLLMMCLQSFGREFGSGAITNLLSQPISRERIWWTKSLLLLAGMLAVVAVFCAAVLLAPSQPGFSESDQVEMLVGGALIGATLYSGALWTVLVLRHVGIAFWITVLVPCAILMLVVHWGERHSAPYGSKLVFTLLSYSVIGFIVAWRLFLRLEDVQWTGGTIRLPWLARGMPIRSRNITSGSELRRHRPVAAMFGRELRLHESQFVIAGSLAILHLAAIGTRRFVDLHENDAWWFVLEHFWVLWFFMPVLIGCAAVAEERKLGTLEGALCLPVRARTQFGVKLAVAIGLSILFGAALPALLEGNRILPELRPWDPSRMPVEPRPWAWIEFPSFRFAFLAGCVGLAGAVAFYCSSLSRNTLQALGPTILSLLLAFPLTAFAYWPESVLKFTPWRGIIAHLIGFPIWFAVLLALALWNFRRVLIGWSVWRRNLAVLALTGLFIVSTASATYHRVWEIFTSLEPTPGPARLKSAIMQGWNWRWIPVQLNDGRVWLTHTVLDPAKKRLDVDPTLSFAPGRFLDGSNWVSVATSVDEIVAVSRDGSLWVSQQNRISGDPGWSEIPEGAYNLARFGNESEWKQARSMGGRSALLLKKDGTLWFWGPVSKEEVGKNLRNFEPKLIGTNFVWEEIINVEHNFGLRARSGELFANVLGSSHAEKVKLRDNWIMSRAPALENFRWKTLITLFDRINGARVVGVNTNGNFQAFARLHSPDGRTWELVADEIAISQETNWVDCAEAYFGYEPPLVLLRNDGTLWQWEVDFQHPEKSRKKQLGRRTDWIAIVSTGESIVSLAADGGLWLWHLQSVGDQPRRLGSVSLLAPSRRPERIAGLFD